MNNFWPVGTTLQNVQDLAGAALPRIARECLEFHFRLGTLNPDEFEIPGEVRFTNLPAAGKVVFVLGAVNEMDVKEIEEEVPVAASSSKNKKKKASKSSRSTTTQTGVRQVTVFHYRGQIRTIAPDGPSSLSFMKIELQAISRELG